MESNLGSEAKSRRVFQCPVVFSPSDTRRAAQSGQQGAGLGLPLAGSQASFTWSQCKAVNHPRLPYESHELSIDPEQSFQFNEALK